MGLATQKRRLRDLFPTKWSFVIFILYMVLFINQGILVTSSQEKGKEATTTYKYSTVMAVLLTELIKLGVSAAFFVYSVHSELHSAIKNDASSNKRYYSASQSINLSQNCYSLYISKLQLFINYSKLVIRNSATVFVKELSQNVQVFCLYFIPAGLYCLYNNMSFLGLANFDPTTYYLLLQFRVVVTGIAFQLLFQKQLSKFQWLSLCLLTLGCMIKQLNFGWLFDPDELTSEALVVEQHSDKGKKGFLENPIGVLLLLIQVLCSSFAGVYNEFLLKRPSSSTQKHLPILLQNVCLYIDSIICNLILLSVLGKFSEVSDLGALRTILSTPSAVAVIINNAAVGIVTSFFLAQLNSILKAFASGLELIFTAILCWIIFGMSITYNTIVAIFIVTTAIWLYAKEPVHNPAAVQEEDMQKILNEELDV